MQAKSSFLKKGPKNFCSWCRWTGCCHNPQLTKVFCFFFKKKKRFLPQLFSKRPQL
jgi:hypothetical protein